MTIYLNSYRPLVRYYEGQKAIEKYNLPPFIDYSPRREPDFQSPYPSISALCRVDKFAPRLYEGDQVVYITVQGKYPGSEELGWRLVAILDVFKRFESHSEAALWYKSQGVALPRNCMVPGNDPDPIDMTAPITCFETDLCQC